MSYVFTMVKNKNPCQVSLGIVLAVSKCLMICLPSDLFTSTHASSPNLHGYADSIDLLGLPMWQPQLCAHLSVHIAVWIFLTFCRITLGLDFEILRSHQLPVGKDADASSSWVLHIGYLSRWTKPEHITEYHQRLKGDLIMIQITTILNCY